MSYISTKLLPKEKAWYNGILEYLKAEKKKKAFGFQNRANFETVASFNKQQKLKYLPLKQCFPWKEELCPLRWQQMEILKSVNK